MPLSPKLRTTTVALFAALVLVLPMSSFASHVAGVKATVTNADPNTLQVDLDLTEYYDGSSTPWSTAYIGYSAVYPTFYRPAIDWGDGSYLSPQSYPNGIPIVATSTPISGFPGTYHIYRGSFSHTYGAQGNYNITVSSTCCGGFTSSNVTITGNPVIVTLTQGVDQGRGPGTYYVLNFTNQAQANLVDAGGGEESILAIPTLSATSLLMLAGALAFAGLLLLRRS